MKPEHQFGKYRILMELGAGGFATVYKAVDTTLDREVALKILHPPLLTDRRFVQNFRLEAKTLAALRHPQIITVYEVGEVDGRLFIAMDLAHGLSLEQSIAKRERIPWDETLALLKPVCEALDYAHGQKVVHRDLKPANLLLDTQRGALLTDFGFARLMAENTMSMSMSGGIVGTPGYIAPEVWEDNAASPPVDIYALGCIVYEMLTGDVLFKGQTPIQAMRAHDRGPQLPATWPEGVPAGITAVLSKALARDPAARYPSASALWHALNDLEAQAQAQRAVAQRATLAAQWRAEAERALGAKEWDAVRMAIGRWRAVAPEDAAIREIQTRLERLSTPQTRPSEAYLPEELHGRSIAKGLSRRDFLRIAALGLGTITGGSLLAIWWTKQPAGDGPTNSNPTVSGTLGGATAPPAAGGAAQATVEWWDSQTGGDEEITKKMIDTFQQKNPDIKINRTYIAQDQGTQVNQKLLTAIAGGTPPDVYKFDRFIVAQFAAQDFLTDLTDLASKAGVKQDDYWPFAWEEANYNGKLYALPYDTDTRALWYNKSIFKEAGLDPEKPPQNTTELADMSAKLMKKDGNKVTRFGFNPIADQAWAYTYGFAWKGEFQDAATKKITTANPKVVESMKWLADFAKSIGTDQLDAFVAACAGSNCIDANDYFWTGQQAMVFSGDWKVGQAKKYKPDVQYGVVPFPGPDGPAPYASWAGGWSWVVPKGAKNPEAAFKVVNWVCGPEGQDLFCKATYHIPTNKKTAADPYYIQDSLHKVFMDLLPVSHTRPPIPAGSLLWDELLKARDAIWHGTTPPEDALKAVDDKVNAELGKLGFFKK